MKKWIILKAFRLHLFIDKKSENFTFIHYLLIVIVTATLTAYTKRFVNENFFSREPAENATYYDYVPPEVPLSIHEALRGAKK